MMNIEMMKAYNAAVAFFNDTDGEDHADQVLRLMQIPEILLSEIERTARRYNVQQCHSSFQEIAHGLYLNARNAVSAMIETQNKMEKESAGKYPVLTKNTIDFGGDVWDLTNINLLEKTKENAFIKTVTMLCQSWTWGKMTGSEREQVYALLWNANPSGTYNQRCELYTAVYHAYLVGIGYNPVSWR